MEYIFITAKHNGYSYTNLFVNTIKNKKSAKFVMIKNSLPFEKCMENK